MPSGGIKREKILSFLADLEKRLKRLKELRRLPRAEFLADFRNVDATIYNLQVAIEAMVDTCNHIIVREIHQSPKTYADSFQILAQAGILPEEDLPLYIAMAKFRNRVVHMYDEVTPAQVYEILQDHYDDYQRFIDQIQRYLEGRT
ncbi:MAG: DUF86 domain-containing protein [Bacillota bacterium]|nr:DUF86 domain-containing protein [Bacillota bacterium]